MTESLTDAQGGCSASCEQVYCTVVSGLPTCAQTWHVASSPLRRSRVGILDLPTPSLNIGHHHHSLRSPLYPDIYYKCIYVFKCIWWSTHWQEMHPQLTERAELRFYWFAFKRCMRSLFFDKPELQEHESYESSIPLRTPIEPAISSTKWKSAVKVLTGVKFWGDYNDFLVVSDEIIIITNVESKR